MTVSLVKFDGTQESLRTAIALCDGFGKLNPGGSVLIKPNNCFRHPITPPFGMVTTTAIVEGLVRLLLEHGFRDISIGEGAIIGIFDELDPYTKRAFKGSGIDKLAKKYGVKLIDFNEGPFQEMDLGGVRAQVAKAPLETDFLVNVPALKTHFQTKVSLGFKNLKGCLSKGSKKRFHRSGQLDHAISALNEVVKSDLVVVDGIYMLEKGPETLAGVAHRKNLIIAATDVLECDMVGASVLGFEPSQVAYLKEYAERHGRPLSLDSLEIRGEDIDVVREKLEWQFVPDEQLLSPSGVTGLIAPPPGQSLCCACAATLALTLSMLAKDNAGLDFGGAQFYYGLELGAERDAADVILYGDCAIRKNKDLVNATRIEGCPPTLPTTMFRVTKALLSRPRRARMLALRAAKLAGIRLGLYHEVFPRWERYRSPEFDRSHFSL
jgi:uncharacterized protein (DUF362 family)